MKRFLLCLSLFAFFGSQAQQINPVPDYVFSNKMSVGRNAVTDTAAYFSIGPRYGAIRGMMPPMVTDTANMSATKRNGLLIFSIQKNKYLYWDSVGSKWAEMAGTAGSAITGSGVAGYMPEFTTSTNLDTTRLYHSAGRFAIGSTTTTNGVFNVYGGQSYFDTSLKVGSKTLLADEGKNEVYVNTTTDSGAYALQVSGAVYAMGNIISAISTITGNLYLGINTWSTVGGYKYLVMNNTTGNIVSFAIDGTEQASIVHNGNTNLGVGTIANLPLTFFTNASEKMRLKADGELLIGTTTDAGAYALQVAGAVYATGNLNFATGDISISNISNNVLAFGTNNTERMRIGANGDVAIGTTNADPFTRGDDRRIAMDASGISSTANVALSLNAGSSAGRGAQLYLGVGGTRHFEISSNSVEQGISAISNTYIKFLTNNTERMRLKADGEVLIGTTTDAGAFTLQMDGNANFNASTAEALRLRGGSGLGLYQAFRNTTLFPLFIGFGSELNSNATINDAVLRYSGSNNLLISGDATERARFNDAGEFLINTTTDAGAYALQVAGAIYNTTTITTGAPTSGSAKPWRLGEAATVSPTSPNRTIRVEIDGTVYYIHAKTTND